MKSVDKRLNEIDVRLSKIEVLLSNHMEHFNKYLYMLASALVSGSVAFVLTLLK